MSPALWVLGVASVRRQKLSSFPIGPFYAYSGSGKPGAVPALQGAGIGCASGRRIRTLVLPGLNGGLVNNCATNRTPDLALVFFRSGMVVVGALGIGCPPDRRI